MVVVEARSLSERLKKIKGYKQCKTNSIKHLSENPFAYNEAMVLNYLKNPRVT
jgi:hypothetical protein